MKHTLKYIERNVYKMFTYKWPYCRISVSSLVRRPENYIEDITVSKSRMSKLNSYLFNMSVFFLINSHSFVFLTLFFTLAFARGSTNMYVGFRDSFIDGITEKA